MPVVAKFEADFSEFSSEVTKAEKDLAGLERTTGSAGAAIIQMGDRSGQAAPKVGNLQSQFKAFDSALSAVGINIGPAVRSIDEFGVAAGQTADKLGAFAKAGLLVSAGMAGWQFGRWIADLTGSDTAIGNSIAKWMGWGDVSKQTAGAVADALAAASKRAGREITTMDEALKVNTEWQKKHKEQAKENREEYEKWEKATAALNVVFQDHQKVLATINPTVVEAAKYALELGANQKIVQDAYALTAGQIAAVADALQKQQDALKVAEEANKVGAAAIKAHWDDVGDIVDQIFGMDLLEKATNWLDAIDAIGGNVQNLRVSEREQLNKTMLEGIDALARSGQLTSDQSSKFAALAVAAQQALEAHRPIVTVTEDLIKVQWEYVTALDEEAKAQKRAADAAKAKADAATGYQSPFGPTGLGGKLSPAAAERYGEWTSPFGDKFIIDKLTGAYVTQLQRLGGAAGDTYGIMGPGEAKRVGALQTNITINGSVLSDPHEIARVVGDALAGAYRSGGNRLPV